MAPTTAPTEAHSAALPGALSARARATRVAKFAWGVLAYNLLVIAWGAYVRASGSGAGCGAHWPLCNGEVVPHPKSIATLIEMTHRATSGIALVAVVVLLVWTRLVLPRGHRARRAAAFSMVFMLGEALVGAGLVLFELVAHDRSLMRGLSMILHLDNTFLLLAALTITAWTITTDSPREAAGREASDASSAAPSSGRSSASVGSLVVLALLSILVLGSSGAIAALGDTLFPSSSLREGVSQDLSPLAHAFLRLRVLHPVIALVSGILVFATASVVRASSRDPRVRLLARVVTLVFATQFAAGLVNMMLLAPVPMQLVHLLLANATWIALVLMGWEALYARRPSRAAGDQRPIISRNGPAPSSDIPPSTSNVDPVT